MTTLPLPSQTLAWLNHAADAGQRDAQTLLHLITRADKRDQDVAVFVDSYSKTIAALCRRLEALERGAGLRHPVEDAEAAQPDSVADTAQRITDYAAQAGLTVQDWAKAFNAAPVPRQAPAATPTSDAPTEVVDGPVADALTKAEAVLTRVGDEGFDMHDIDEAATVLAAIRPVMRQHGIRTSEFPPAAPAPAPATPTPRPTALVEVVGNELPLLPGGKVDQVLTLAVIRKLAAWLDKQGDHTSGNCLRSHIDR